MPGKFKYVFKAWTVIHQGRRKGSQYLRYYYRKDMPAVVRAATKTKASKATRQLTKAAPNILKRYP